MASKRRLRRKQCERKIKHRDRNAAYAAVRHTGKDNRPYRCPWCGWWHIGRVKHDARRQRWAAY